MVYPCKGPYEDFVYAGSFDPKNMKICTPVYSTNHITEFGKMNGYPASRQRYTDQDLRAFVYLVESSKRKSPAEMYFGSYGLWNNQGHISRNLMLTTMIADITRPVLTVQNFSLEFTNEV